MSTSMTDDAGAIRIALSGGHAARLFGLPFLLVGAWMVYYLIRSLIALMTGRAALSEFAFGIIVLAIFTAAFLIPGWLLVASRALVTIDRAADLVTVIRDLRIYQHRQVRKLSEFSRLEVDLLSGANPRRRVSSYQIELVGADRDNVVVGLIDDREEALAFGRRLSALVGLPVEDMRYTERVEEA
jgi:hypothetical protein